MFTVRNAGGVALFLFGTTVLWLTPMFASAAVSTKGAWWSVTQVLALPTVVGLTVAAFGLFTRRAGGRSPRSRRPCSVRSS